MDTNRKRITKKEIQMPIKHIKRKTPHPIVREMQTKNY